MRYLRKLAVYALVVFTCAALARHAHADSISDYVQVELGQGITYTHDLGDGTWYQQGVPHTENLWARAYLAGLTGPVITRGPWDVRWHLDYQYFGEQSATCECVTDAQYVRTAHTATVPGYIPFSSFGHVQGVSLTADTGYTWHGYRFSFEIGPWVFWDTWHVHRVDPAQPGVDDLSHKTVAQLGGVAGFGIGTGATRLSFRYYYEPIKANPYPGIANGTYMLIFTHQF
jgi:hypothetical protein